MTIEEYFGDWWSVINHEELNNVISKLNILYKKKECTPSMDKVFKVFASCSRKNCKVIILGQDPYPQKGVATGLAFANSKDTLELSPSLKILKNTILNLEIPHNLCTFDQTLEDIAQQGVLFLNSALTVEVGNVGSHQLLWRPFIKDFLINLCQVETGLVFVLLGSQAVSFKPYIGKYNTVIECGHPSYYARTNIPMPDVFTEVNKVLEHKYGEHINWYQTY